MGNGAVLSLGKNFKYSCMNPLWICNGSNYIMMSMGYLVLSTVRWPVLHAALAHGWMKF